MEAAMPMMAFFGAAPALEAEELGLQVAALGADGGPRGLDCDKAGPGPPQSERCP